MIHFIFDPRTLPKNYAPKKCVYEREVQSSDVRINGFSYATARVALRSISCF